MGQGEYVALVWGVNDTEVLEERAAALWPDDGIYHLADALNKDCRYLWEAKGFPIEGWSSWCNFRTAYECEPYFGLRIGASSGVAPELERSAVPVGDLAAWLGQGLVDAKVAWEIARTVASVRYNLDLPEGRLLLVVDYD